jgi:hypothetical protein
MTDHFYKNTLEVFRDLIANCASWITWTGAANATAAEAFVSVGATSSVTRPFALIALRSHTLERIGTPNTFTPSGAIYYLRIEAGRLDVGVAGSTEEYLYLSFLDHLAELVDDIIEKQGTSTYPSISSIKLISPVNRPKKEEITTYGDIVQAEFEITCD